ncbi:CPA1 family monovalent cation:H+ antiporter [Pelomonas saccharophila]|uniref:CPA1 family monovalent cation:H+ antiporter n=1 Tax=Roseateles saccharophilus TaxID=304 RepID=A0ABU1YVP0_ROSSA|nr:sodium:proton antiporter [Roseateles saccharophilus]MDR7272788.1 CPA1 family monovalent cation:H+ antiporter [Roseateles saccharophilus]
MHALEQILILFVAAVVLAATARRAGAPYPVFLAIGGALLALIPGAPSLSLPPDLVLALFVAPILVDAGYDASLRDLKDNWAPLVSLVVVAVGLTTAAVAIVVHTLVPGLPWAAAIALGAIVAPPDAVAATAVLRPLRPPQRILGILEGESLLNDASALLIYRLAVGAAAAGGFSMQAVGPTFLLAVLGSLIAGPALGFIAQRLFERVQHIPTAIILQFVGTFTVWQLAEHVGLSGVLTTVCFAMTLARLAPERIPPRIRIPTNAVWATVVFALNIFAFIFIGLQLRPILMGLEAPAREQYLGVAAAVLATVIGVRIVWHMSFNAVIRWRDRRHGFNPPRPMLRPTVGSGLVISWAGMRGIVTLAAALALPEGFPGRDLIVLTAFLVVLGTLLIQGLTLKPLLRALKLQDGDPVAHEEHAARHRMLEAAFAQLPTDGSAAVNLVRKNLKMHLGRPLHESGSPFASFGAEYDDRYRAALQAARRVLLAMRDAGDIGDDAFHTLENDLDWLEVSDPLRAANADATE